MIPLTEEVYAKCLALLPRSIQVVFEHVENSGDFAGPFQSEAFEYYLYQKGTTSPDFSFINEIFLRGYLSGDHSEVDSLMQHIRDEVQKMNAIPETDLENPRLKRAIGLIKAAVLAYRKYGLVETPHILEHNRAVAAKEESRQKRQSEIEAARKKRKEEADAERQAKKESKEKLKQWGIIGGKPGEKPTYRGLASFDTSRERAIRNIQNIKSPELKLKYYESANQDHRFTDEERRRMGIDSR